MSKGSSQQEVVAEVDPAIIYFTFSRICPTFSCGRPIAATLAQMESGALAPSDLPLLTVFVDARGDYFSQNNRRLYLYKQLRERGRLTTVPVRLRPLPQTRRMADKYSRDKCALTATLSHKTAPPAARGGKERSGGDSDNDDDGSGQDDAPASRGGGGKGAQPAPTSEHETEAKTEKPSQAPVAPSRTQEKKNKRLAKRNKQQAATAAAATDGADDD